jgi:hypothetical protein
MRMNDAYITTGEVIKELDGKLASMACVSSYNY